MDDLISRKALISHIENQSREWGEDYDVQQILGDIEDMPPVNTQDCDTCEVGNPCLYCKHEFEPKVPDTNDGNMSEIPTGSESEDKEIKTNTHIVIKREDIFRYLTDNQIKYLDVILYTIAYGRKKDGKKTDNSYYICNTDEPYADEVLKVILKAERSE